MWDEYAIVDDNKFDRLICQRIVQRIDQNASTLEFENGRGVLDYVISKPDLSGRMLIFLDINMPEMDGHEFIRHLMDNARAEAILNHIQIAIMTSSSRTEDKTDTMRLPFVIGFLQKPIMFEKVQEVFK